MRIGIDARFFGAKTGGGGIGRYTAELIANLQKLDQENEYVLFLNRNNFHECKITNPRFSKRLVNIPWYGITEQKEMPKHIRRAKVDLMHYPHWNIPIFSETPFVVTIHDLILLEDRQSAHSTTKNFLIHGFKYAGFRLILENAIHRSKHIITISQYSQQSILKHFGITKEKITIIPNGITVPPAAKFISLTSLAVYQPYFLYVGNAYPHKNLEMMLHAFSIFHANYPHTQLVIAGRRDIFSKRLEKEVDELQLPLGSVRFIDFPGDEELGTLYKNASLFIFPSRLEGFGMPPLEAMAHKTPVASSSAASMPEVLKNCAFFFDPDDTEKLIEYMETAIKHQNKIKSKTDCGERLAKSYTWQKTAAKTLAIYQSIRLLNNKK